MSSTTPIARGELEALRRRTAPIEELARERKGSLALVGGAVRDLLLGLPFRDLDLVFEGNAVALVDALVRRFGGCAGAHHAFGTAKWLAPDGQSFEIASARREQYSRPGALPEVRPASLIEDLGRRDFTINSMALVLSTDEPRLLDPFDGSEALRSRKLHVLHDVSFDDDPTRIWRALRFCARLDLSLGLATRGAMDGSLDRNCLGTLSLQRLGAEIHRAWGEPRRPLVALATEWRLWRYISPELTGGRGLVEVTEQSPEGEAQCGRLAWLMLSAALSGPERRRLADLIPGDGRAREQWIRGDERVAKALDVDAFFDPGAAPSKIARSLEWMTVDELALLNIRGNSVVRHWLDWWELEGRGIETVVDGRMLQALGLEAGPSIGLAKAAALDAARDGASPEAQTSAALAIVEDGNDGP